ncbi:S-adenosyl-L-methionine-dependent methyltransferase [Fusarium oxysporum]|nr:S-adenosyl-L-methionine-dependent methyltransferase [Fusarium oxysporum]
MSTSEATFWSYTQAQGESYATGRPGYFPELFKIILNHHASSGGRLDTVLDVGCGTGQATGDLAPFFNNAIGIDPSEGMITFARETIKSSALSIRFEVSAAEALGIDLEPPIANNSVDLLTAATAAHWFDMTQFWRSAARVVEAGGTVALWARTGMSVDPTETPNGAAIKVAYYKQGNTLTRDLYVDLPLPWTIETPVTGFDKSGFICKEWSHNTESSETEDLGTGKTLTPEEFEKLIGTSSPVARWREANPDKAGTEEDVARKARGLIYSFLHEVGVELDEELLRGRTELVLLMVKKEVEERTQATKVSYDTPRRYIIYIGYIKKYICY